ncbi:MAG: hypothetical protein GY841_08895 [FCB group bacterium]|nr:hypothetical protein [FCB group bacterium]
MKSVFVTITVVCLALFWAGSAMGVDKTKKDKTPPPEKTAKIEQKTEADPTKFDSVTSANSSRSKKTYNNFIDNNNNGIDDRAEKKTSVKKVKKDTTQQSASPANP